MRKWFVLSALVVLAVAASLPASATVPLTSTGPFTGDYSETWESFQTYPAGPYYLGNPTSIMGGEASISNGYMYIYQPGAADFSLDQYGNATVSDGINGMGMDCFTNTVTITAEDTWSSFGAYWGAIYAQPTVYIEAFDIDGKLIDAVKFSYEGINGRNDNPLIWHGWTSDIAIKSLTYTGDCVVIDGLQANEYKQTSAVPEPATLLGFGLPMLMVGLGKLKSLRK